MELSGILTVQTLCVLSCVRKVILSTNTLVKNNRPSTGSIKIKWALLTETVLFMKGQLRWRIIMMVAMTTILMLTKSISDYSNLMQMTVFYFSSVWERFPAV